MKIGIDIYGGDFAPEANIDGVLLAFKELPDDVIIVLIGDKSQITSKFQSSH
jgi:glycerol-3-phosphate acyltransferase PlsX